MFKVRSYKKELLDNSGIPKEDLYQNLSELNIINSLLGGYNVILSGIKKLIALKTREEIYVLDIGSGGGDTLKSIDKKFNQKHSLQLTGVDLKEDCITYAKENCKGHNIQFIHSDYRELQSDSTEYDIITASLFCHHLNDEEIVALLKWMYCNAKLGIVINDIHRHFLAYHSIRLLTHFFSSSYLVKNDAPLSVLRAFTKKELIELINNAGISDYSITWKWAFRWMVCIKTAKN